MTFTTYLKLLFHAVVTTIIIMSLPVLMCVVHYNVLPNWATLVIGLLSAIPTLFAGIKYIFSVSKRIL